MLNRPKQAAVKRPEVAGWKKCIMVPTRTDGPSSLPETATFHLLDVFVSLQNPCCCHGYLNCRQAPLNHHQFFFSAFVSHPDQKVHMWVKDKKRSVACRKRRSTGVRLTRTWSGLGGLLPGVNFLRPSRTATFIPNVSTKVISHTTDAQSRVVQPARALGSERPRPWHGWRRFTSAQPG